MWLLQLFSVAVLSGLLLVQSSETKTDLSLDTASHASAGPLMKALLSPLEQNENISPLTRKERSHGGYGYKGHNKGDYGGHQGGGGGGCNRCGGGGGGHGGGGGYGGSYSQSSAGSWYGKKK